MKKPTKQPYGRGDRLHPALLSIALRLFAAIPLKRDRAVFLTAYRHGYGQRS